MWRITDKAVTPVKSLRRVLAPIPPLRSSVTTSRALSHPDPPHVSPWLLSHLPLFLITPLLQVFACRSSSREHTCPELFPHRTCQWCLTLGIFYLLTLLKNLCYTVIKIKMSLIARKIFMNWGDFDYLFTCSRRHFSRLLESWKPWKYSVEKAVSYRPLNSY